MANFQQKQNRRLSLTGSGQQIWIGLYQNDLFVKFLRTGISTVLNVTQNVDINTEAVGDTDSIPLGDNWDVVVGSEVSHPSAAVSVGDAIADITNGGPFIPRKFSVVMGNADFPSIFWNSLGSYCSVDRVFADTAETQPSEFNANDATNGVVGSLPMRLNTNISDAFFEFMQSTTATKPLYKFDSTVSSGYIEFRVDTLPRLDITATGLNSFTNDDFVDSSYSFYFDPTTAVDGREFFDFGDGMTLESQQGSTAWFQIKIGSIRVASQVPQGYHNLYVSRSAGAGFGNTRVWLDGVVVYDQPTYTPAVTLTSSMRCFRQSGTSGIAEARFYAGMYNHKGALNDTERAAVITYMGDLVGLTI